jgi:transaldolase
MLTSGQLERLRDAGVSGVTANPTIFARALQASDVYRDEISRRSNDGQGAEDVLWSLLIEDVQAAADVLRPVHDSTRGADGFVSIEVSPEIAGDTEATVESARDLRARCDRPNVMVKIPATPAGLPAIRRMIGEGANINVTLIFAVDRYVEVVEAFMGGLEDLLAKKGDPGTVHSVASFFVSRVDSKVDQALKAQIDSGGADLKTLLGRAGIANSKVAYRRFGELHRGARWEVLAAAGARVQRCLWASTSVKDERYRDTMYVEELIGPQTINTMPPKTFEAFQEHGVAARTLDGEVDQALSDLDRLKEADIDLAEVTAALEAEGVESFAKSYRESLESLSREVASRRS